MAYYRNVGNVGSILLTCIFKLVGNVSEDTPFLFCEKNIDVFSNLNLAFFGELDVGMKRAYFEALCRSSQEEETRDKKSK